MKKIVKKDIGEYTKYLYEKHGKNIYVEIKTYRNAIVHEGKHSKKLFDIGKKRNKPNDPKYNDPDNMSRTGACSVPDCIFLATIVKEYNPGNILEIGTWFGTTSAVMASEITGNVYTCDNTDVFVDSLKSFDRIKRTNDKSANFLKKILDDKNIEIDLTFVDGTLMAGDCRLLKKLKPKVYVFHDWRVRKGPKNLKAMMKILNPDKYDVLVPKRKGIGYLVEDNEYPIHSNEQCFVIKPR